MGESIRVLYVDDDPARGPTVESLEREDDRLEVVTESSPGDALARLRSDPTAADCVVSDYDVPGMTGVEFVERIRARFPGRSLPIVLFTSERSEEVAANALNAGAAGYVPKGEPDSVDRLVERIVGGAADPHARRESDRDGTLPDALADPGYVLDEEGTFIDVNDGFADLVGDDRESLVGADLDRVAGAEAAATIETNLARVRSEDGLDVVRFEAEIVPKRGDRVVTEHRVESVSDGLVRGSTDILRSATARRDLKHRIERLRDAIRELARTGNRDAVCRTAVRTVTDALGYPASGVWLGDDAESLEPAAVSDVGSDEGDLPSHASGDRPLREAFRTGAPTLSRGAGERPGDVADAPTESELVLPLGDHGVMIVTSVDRTGIDGLDRSLVELLAANVETALDRAERDRTARRFRRLFEQSVDSIILHAADGRIVDVNEQACETLGYDRERLVGMDVSDIDRGLSPDELRALWAGMRPGEIENVNSVHRRADGTEFPVEVRVGRLDAPDEDIFFAAARDITERRERERRLKARSTAMEASIDGIAILDENREYTFVNQAHADIYGYDDPEAFVGESWGICYDDSERERMRKEVLPTLFEEGSWRGEGIGTRRDGSSFPQELSLTVMEDGVVCVVRDVTERRKYERELRETNRLLQTILDTTTAAVFVKDSEGRYRLMNDTCCDVLGIGEEEAVGRTDYDLFSEEIADRYRADDRRVLRDRETIRVEEEVPTADGMRTFLTLKSPIFDESGAPDGICAVTTDITERVEYKRELERQNDRLEKFTSIVSHDLRTPLTTAAGRLELATEECDSHHLDAIARSLDRIGEIIDETLTLAREGRTVGDREPVRFSDRLDRWWEDVATANAELEVEAGVAVRGDPGRLRQLFENLFRNAVGHGGRSVTVRVGALDGGGFYVEDDGPGIPADERDAVFEHGYTTADGGIGFGLAIVEEIVKAHGWEIRVAESDDGGARFEITGVETP
jgi:PAS domain S-box-containing protein